MREVEMKEGATISGVMHLTILAVLLFGTDFLSARESAPLNVTEVALVDGTELDAAVSAAPQVPKEAPDVLQPKRETDLAVPDLSVPDVAIQAPEMPVLSAEDQPTDAAPDFSAVLVPPPPTVIVTEPPRASIAEVPVIDEVLRQAPTPESPPSTEPVQALAAAPKPVSAPRPMAPPEPEPEAAPKPEPEPEAEKQPEPEPEKLVESPKAEEEPAPDPGETAQPGPAPREARLPVAKPAKLAAASRASSKPEPQAVTPKEKEPEPEPEQKAAPKPAPPAATAQSQFASIITPGEKDALRLGIKQYFIYNGNRSDPSLYVKIAIRLASDATIIGVPELIDAGGGDGPTQDVLFRSGRRALLRAEAAGEFKKLPPEKYDGWKLIHVTFTPEEIGFST